MILPLLALCGTLLAAEGREVPRGPMPGTSWGAGLEGRALGLGESLDPGWGWSLGASLVHIYSSGFFSSTYATHIGPRYLGTSLGIHSLLLEFRRDEEWIFASRSWGAMIGPAWRELREPGIRVLGQAGYGVIFPADIRGTLRIEAGGTLLPGGRVESFLGLSLGAGGILVFPRRPERAERGALKTGPG